MSRECKKCKKIIPNWIKVDGVSKNLQNRKFCLECSPFGKHNTSSIDPVIRKERTNRYSHYTDDQRNKSKLVCYKRGLERKVKLVELSGGKCQKCGYDKCKRALSFHHRNPADKIFPLSLSFLWSKAWEEIYLEWQKCDMLCLNCHIELEDSLIRENKFCSINKINETWGTNY